MKDNTTRVFFTVWTDNTQKEIFETLEEADNYVARAGFWPHGPNRARIAVSIVKNAYKEHDTGNWNYEDYSDTFRLIHNIQ